MKKKKHLKKTVHGLCGWYTKYTHYTLFISSTTEELEDCQLFICKDQQHGSYTQVSIIS